MKKMGTIVSDEKCDMTSKMLFSAPPPHIAAFYRRKGKRS